MEQNMFLSVLPLRHRDAHKGSFGSVAIIGGDTGMVGAVLLAARAALYCGTGRIYAAMLSASAPAIDVCHPEIMLRSPAAIAQLPQLDSVVIGPGLGQSQPAIELLEFWLVKDKLLLLDADALNLIASYPHLTTMVKNRNAETVITPHAGEAARLLATSSEHIQKNRTENALKLAQSLQVTCVLKGADTVCAQHDGRSFVNTCLLYTSKLH